MAVNPNEELKMTYSSVLSKDGKPMVSIQFTRGNDICEGCVPDCVILKNNGFTKEEVDSLEQYMKMNRKEIIDSSKRISGFMNIFGK